MAQITEVALLLASASPRRRELLERVGVRLDVVPAKADETVREGEAAPACARRLARAKAEAVAREHADRWVLGADTVVEIDGVILGKAETGDEAAAMLRQLAGRTHRVITGVALVGPGGDVVTAHVLSEVDVRRLEADEIADYVAAGEWRGKAGAYAVQGMAAAMVTAVRGSITNVIGLPLSEVLGILRAAGMDVPNYQAGSPV